MRKRERGDREWERDIEGVRERRGKGEVKREREKQRGNWKSVGKNKLGRKETRKIMKRREKNEMKAFIEAAKQGTEGSKTDAYRTCQRHQRGKTNEGEEKKISSENQNGADH